MSEDSAGDRSPLELRDYLGVLLRRSWIVVIVTGIVFGVGVYRSKQQTRVYQAQGQLELTTINKDSDLQTQMRVIESPVVHDAAARATAGIGQASAQQAGLGSIITVSATDTDPQRAARTVNATIDAYVVYFKEQGAVPAAATTAAMRGRIDELQKQIDKVQKQINAATAAAPAASAASAAGSALVARRGVLITEQSTIQQRLDSLQFDLASAGTGINVVARATAPAGPIRPNPRSDGLIALGAGLLLGLVLAFFFEYLVRSSPTSRAAAVLPQTLADATVTGVIAGGRAVNGVASLSAPDSGAARSYRSLGDAAALMGLGRGRCIEVTSAPDRDGKSETLTNLAVLLARGGRRVVVVDCDLRTPRVHELFGLSNETGFTSVMRGSSLPETLQRVPNVDHLYALTSGPLPANPEEMLASDRCVDVLSSLLTGGTLVLIDTPPLLPLTDALTLASTVPVDDVLLVASPRTNESEHVRQALDALQRTAAQQVGVVLAGADAASDDPPVQTDLLPLLASSRNGGHKDDADGRNGLLRGRLSRRRVRRPHRSLPAPVTSARSSTKRSRS